MKRLSLFFVVIIMTTTSFAQSESESLNREVSLNKWGTKLVSPTFHLGLDIQTKYIWRGMEMMTNDAAPVVFPGINYSKGGFYAYVMGGYSINGKYSEVDMGLSYTYNWLTVGVNDYYYPTTTVPEDQYFSFNKELTGHWLEAVVTITPEAVPLFLTLSNFFYGADKTLEGKQAYSTYAELGGHYDFLNDNSLSLTLGAALNNSCYNGYAQNVGICNIEFKYTYNVSIDSFALPLSVAYVINPVYNKAHVNFSTSFAF